LTKAGEKPAKLLNKRIRNVAANQIQIDQIWRFVHSKQKHLRPEQARLGFGGQYTFVAIDSKSKLVVSHIVGRQNGINSDALMMDLATRVSGRF